MKAMILAAGLGTRLKPFTDHHPKALAIVNGKSLLQRNIEYLQDFGIDEVVVNVHHFADQIIDAIEKNNGWGCNRWGRTRKERRRAQRMMAHTPPSPLLSRD
jgi:NDP-sugar pyrophosphorylase family protein